MASAMTLEELLEELHLLIEADEHILALPIVDNDYQYGQCAINKVEVVEQMQGIGRCIQLG
jgi:hypothetical protein